MRRICLAVIASLFLAAPAAAGGCCGGDGGATYEVQPVVPVSTYRFDAPPPVSQVYVVNQGPLLSGPGLYTYTNHYVPSFVPTGYPYAGGCGGYGGCGYSYGCCGHAYTYSYGCGRCGAYWPRTVAPYQWDGGQRAWHRYHVWLHHHAPRAGTVAPARGY